jgi:hypothetical protein
MSRHIKKTTFPKVETFEEEVRQLAEHYDQSCEYGHGFFFDFSNTPEHEEPVLTMLVEEYGWILEKPFFIRKGLERDPIDF